MSYAGTLRRHVTHNKADTFDGCWHLSPAAVAERKRANAAARAQAARPRQAPEPEAAKPEKATGVGAAIFASAKAQAGRWLMRANTFSPRRIKKGRTR